MGSVKCHVVAGASAAVKVLKGSRSPPYKLQPQVLEPIAFKSRALLFVLRNTFWICVGAETLCEWVFLLKPCEEKPENPKIWKAAKVLLLRGVKKILFWPPSPKTPQRQDTVCAEIVEKKVRTVRMTSKKERGISWRE
ncbi:hypothetical protein NW761_012818 [Fusarium oxysporum]|jgi:hypothetical protein|uniref:Uncharacterized protein n=2 Tax=Fusarium oxysporum TaxID=5507 RepID=X0LLC7_FUSOX|nr:hypothetical protein FOVG_11503 [Fusarium oxysporum f. sp. pisi HDV247]EXM21791.1 hypothetical protein FOTG_10399 [Fusarium oxysporum f. sp. vasinfectum 25433]KAJ4032262.1 hypothetical protein NW758_011939 [Fusarium oxysporum]EXA37225.1 hypothetical protein FOVG_11503 [Fusarium oxysporum f. sp. pisi HDV247]EXA37226.1 hypothetical protein FOVG_11503 [Fusarium oxysporum f. sp. pisi HDV247]